MANRIALLSILVVTGCYTDTTPHGITAIDLGSGEIREFASEDEVPPGWATCPDGTDSCPEPHPCDMLDPTTCGVRPDCAVSSEDPSDPGDPMTGGGCIPAECPDEACGPALGMPVYLCEDGSTGGSTGRCLALPDGTCGWEITECPTPVDCTDEECGPSPGIPSWICDDGTIGGLVGCLRGDMGMCGWVIRDCAPSTECTPEECGPAPGADFMCPDGSSAESTCERDPFGTCGWVFSCSAMPVPPPVPTCPEDLCGELPAIARICDDGSTGIPLCVAEADGTCGWEHYCPPSEPPAPPPEPGICPDDACGEIPAIARICPDGSTGVPLCSAGADGLCSWEFVCGASMGGGG